MVTPQQVADAFPPDETTQPRWRESVKRFMLELPPAVAESLKPLVAGLQQQVAEAIAQLSFTRAETDAKIASPGAIAPTTVTASGAITSAGSIVGATGRFDSGLYSLDARNFIVQQNYAALWADVNGHVGISPSSRRFKTDIETWQVDAGRLFEFLRARRFHPNIDQPIGYDELGDPVLGPRVNPSSLPWQYGLIAEELVEAGLGMFTFEDADGQLLGINYDRIVVALFDVARQQQNQIDEHSRRLDALEGRAE